MQVTLLKEVQTAAIGITLSDEHEQPVLHREYDASSTDPAEVRCTRRRMRTRRGSVEPSHLIASAATLVSRRVGCSMLPNLGAVDG